MASLNRTLIPSLDRGPLRTMFLVTSMPVGGAETLLVNLLRRLDRDRFTPSLCCLKELGPLGEMVSSELPTFCQLTRGRFDITVLGKLRNLMRRERIDAVVTVGAGDKMFWGRIAARREHAPVILSALHSTGWPDSIGCLNRLLTSITDGFIAVAGPHSRHLVEREGFPCSKVHVIPNGVDVSRFRPLLDSGLAVRKQCGIPLDAPVCGIVAALRTEKNHLLFIRAAALASQREPHAHFLVIGDGPERPRLEAAVQAAGLAPRIHFLGSRSDVPQVLAAMDVFTLTSHNEANPVSILEALACERPVVATDVGSVSETVRDGKTGYLVPAGDAAALADRWIRLFHDRALLHSLGSAGRQAVAEHWSLERMVAGYQTLITDIYDGKCTKSKSQPVAAKPLPV